MNTCLQTLEPKWSPLVSTGKGILQRACDCGNHTAGGGECSGCKKNRELQRSPGNNTSVASAPQTRNFFESRFGRDLSRVQTHSIAPAIDSSFAVGVVQRQIESSDESENSASEPSNAGENIPATEEAQGEAEGATEPAPDRGPELAALTAIVDELSYTVRGVRRDNGLPGRTTEVGSTNCNPETGQPEWRIDRSRIAECMWPCAERHEQTHAEFLRMPCERVWLPIARARFWIRVTGQYAQQGNLPEAERAMREANAAVEEGRREVQWYLMYMAQTCRYDEGTAYQEGIEVCDTPEVRSRCTATGELSQYNIQMEAWRRFSQNPPNCPPQPPPPPRRP